MQATSVPREKNHLVCVASSDSLLALFMVVFRRFAVFSRRGLKIIELAFFIRRVDIVDIDLDHMEGRAGSVKMQRDAIVERCRTRLTHKYSNPYVDI